MTVSVIAATTVVIIVLDVDGEADTGNGEEQSSLATIS